jgi:hypothetical protein
MVVVREWRLLLLGHPRGVVRRTSVARRWWVFVSARVRERVLVHAPTTTTTAVVATPTTASSWDTTAAVRWGAVLGPGPAVIPTRGRLAQRVRGWGVPVPFAAAVAVFGRAIPVPMHFVVATVADHAAATAGRAVVDSSTRARRPTAVVVSAPAAVVRVVVPASAAATRVFVLTASVSPRCRRGSLQPIPTASGEAVVMFTTPAVEFLRMITAA